MSTTSNHPPAARRRSGVVTALVALVVIASSCSSSSHKSQSSIDGPGPEKLPTLPGPTAPPSPAVPGTPEAQLQFISGVFNDIQNTWSNAFRQSRLPYTPATLRTFTSTVGTSCGVQSSEVGPFYCPADKTVNLDLRFFTLLWQQTGAGGDFAEAYVVAHEMGHHIQSVLGISSRVAAADQQNPAGANALSVRVELQADCLAGVWAHTTYTRSLLQPGDLEQALGAAAVVGDDFIQQMSGGQVEPDSWTHGSSAQRQRWLTVGFDSGSPNACDTFSGNI
ncbi:MAG: neutral zinc metallopeptidase [Acidimicrobiales bacterium]|nr:neutral zinc metallopeptidase [Acidimicrobiales bacterium]